MNNRCSTWNITNHDMDAIAHFAESVEKTGHRLDCGKLEAFGLYREEILRVNGLLGLISKNDVDRILLRHFLDSLTPALNDVIPAGAIILDIGSGGGLPGIPLAIFLPDTDFVLVESSRKKITFLRHARRILSLSNVTVLHNRAESLSKAAPGKVYDGAVARAVGSIGQLAAWSSCVLKPGGKLICYKGPNPEEEIEASRKVMEDQGMVLENIHRYEPGYLSSLTLVVLKKTVHPGFVFEGCISRRENERQVHQKNTDESA